MPDKLYQLVILWNGVGSTLNQRSQSLESAQDIWRVFESRKELFSNFLVKAEERMASFFKVLSSTKDLTVMQAKVTAQKVNLLHTHTHIYIHHTHTPFTQHTHTPFTHTTHTHTHSPFTHHTHTHTHTHLHTHTHTLTHMHATPN